MNKFSKYESTVVRYSLKLDLDKDIQLISLIETWKKVNHKSYQTLIKKSLWEYFKVYQDIFYGGLTEDQEEERLKRGLK